MARWILHVDLDQFLVAVEVRRRPELRGRPVIVGGSGDPTQARVVVTSASYEARARGVRAGMPLRTAARKCPEAVFLPSDRGVYEEASAEVMATLRQLPFLVEVWGWDEAVVGADTDDPEALAADLRRQILEETGLSCSIGIGDNKLRAKIATEFGKPQGTFRLTEENWYAVMADRPTDALWGIGKKTATRLGALGVTTVLELSKADARWLADQLGPTMGPWYRRLGRGVDTSPVVGTPYVARSHSRETTFQQNLTEWAEVEAEVRRLAHQVTKDIRGEGRPAIRVAVKLRFAPFDTHTRSLTLDGPTSDADRIGQAAVELVNRFDRDRAVRLLGVRAEMAPPTDD